MRIYIIGNDGIALCREAPATVNDDEVVVGDRGLTGAGATIRRKAPIKAGRGDCNAAATRGRHRG